MINQSINQSINIRLLKACQNAGPNNPYKKLSYRLETGRQQRISL